MYDIFSLHLLKACNVHEAHQLNGNSQATNGDPGDKILARQQVYYVYTIDFIYALPCFRGTQRCYCQVLFETVNLYVGNDEDGFVGQGIVGSQYQMDGWMEGQRTQINCRHSQKLRCPRITTTYALVSSHFPALAV